MRLTRVFMVAILASGASACVEANNGSRIELFLRAGVQIPGNPPDNGRPPSDTHYVMLATTGADVFRIAEFDIRQAIRRAEPCFIEEPGSRFPGLHSTMLEQKLLAVAHDP